MTKQTSIRLNKTTVKKLTKIKIHPRETNEETINYLIQYYNNSKIIKANQK